MTKILSCNRRRGFSLIEVLMAIFILGIGVISIAALLPAGIVQQRQSLDDVMGPIVAGNALSVLRTKLDQEDFGSFEDFIDPSTSNPERTFCPPIGGASIQIAGEPRPGCPRPTIEGDWSWMRPAFIFPAAAPDLYPLGAIDIFNATTSAYAPETVAFESSDPNIDLDIPYDNSRYRFGPPAIIITQQERYYPQATKNPQSGAWEPPQYVWDCMFRRFGGTIRVAIFVYRVTLSGPNPSVTTPDGRPSRAYTVVPNPSNPIPPLPIWLDVTDVGLSAGGAWDDLGPDGLPNTGDENLVLGFPTRSGFDDRIDPQAWQAAGQWIVDQNADVHQVFANSGADGPQPIEVELQRPITPKLALGPTNAPAHPAIWARGGVYWVPQVGADVWQVTDIWYLPSFAEYRVNDVPIADVRLTPIYVTVKEL